MSQHDDELQRAAQMLHGIFQAAKHLCSKAVTGHADNKEIVRSLIEDEFDWHTGVGAAKDGGKWTLLWRAGAAWRKTQIPRVDRDDLLDHARLVLDVVEKRRETPIAVIEPKHCRVAIRWHWSRRNVSRLVAIDYLDRFHLGLPPFVQTDEPIGRYPPP